MGARATVGNGANSVPLSPWHAEHTEHGTQTTRSIAHGTRHIAHGTRHTAHFAMHTDARMRADLQAGG